MTKLLIIIPFIVISLQIIELIACATTTTSLEDDESQQSTVEDFHGHLYPIESQTREVKSLDGLWDFAIIPDSITMRQIEFQLANFIQTLKHIQMPVPSSFNDIPTSPEYRDHVGAVLYARNFYVPASWNDTNKQVVIRFGSVNYHAKVWVNGKFVKNHKIGHLPFEVNINDSVYFGQNNHIDIVVSNVLRKTTIPQGELTETDTDDGHAWIQSYTFDFFNYAGIHRPVLLYMRPRVHIKDININTSISNHYGIIKYDISASGFNPTENIRCKVNIFDADDNLVEKRRGNFTNTIKIPNAKFWWPRGMHATPGYLYTLEVVLYLEKDLISDIYRIPFGIRTLKWSKTTFLINDRPVYMRGFGRHEDSVLRGRGLDLVTMTRDYELLKWVGANAYRTSHYPYSDEVMDMADRQGFLIINESPAVDTDNYSDELLSRHKSALVQLIRRDKNRPSVVMWSLSNEPRIKEPKASEYYKEIAEFIRKIDPSRPITASLNKGFRPLNPIAPHLDIISFNRYNSWYQNTGRLDLIIDNVVDEAMDWHKTFKKPVLMSEYGADALTGMHELPVRAWSGEYQTAMFSKHFEAFDNLRKYSWFIGEFIWSFTDFQTPQVSNRAGGNKKGIFTRTREPKMSAYHVRKRYHALGLEIDKQPLPVDLEYYCISTNST